MKAVRFEEYGGRDVLEVVDVEAPEPGAGQVVVQVRAAGTNPGEAAIREGAMAEVSPSTFPSGQGSDLAGTVVATGGEVTAFAVGDDVLGFVFDRSSQAEYAVADVDKLTRKPPEMPWEVAGSLYVVGATAYAAARAVGAGPGDSVVVSAAAGGVGSVLVQLLQVRGVETVVGIASEDNHDWLRSVGVVPAAYGDGLAERLRELLPDGPDAFVDLFGPDYVDLAIDLGVAPERINTIISFEKAEEVGAKTEGSAGASTPEVLSEMAELVVSGRISVPIAASYPLTQVREAYERLEDRHTHGKIVLTPQAPDHL